MKGIWFVLMTSMGLSVTTSTYSAMQDAHAPVSSNRQPAGHRTTCKKQQQTLQEFRRHYVQKTSVTELRIPCMQNYMQELTSITPASK
jgi:hypothetical protein